VAELLKRLEFQQKKKPKRGFVIPDLPAARAMWDAKMFPVPWDEETNWDIGDDSGPDEKMPF